MPVRKPLTSILVKPAGPDCNLACTYCFYLKKGELFPDAPVHRMNGAVLEEMVRQFLEQGGREVNFGWQGGEPTLMGLPFFEKAVELQQRYGRGQVVGNGLQTNGILLDRKWARFLHAYSFLVGLSLDGPEHVHDRYRRRRDGSGTWAAVTDRAKLLLDAGVAVNALVTVNDYSVRFADEIYDFLKELGFVYMQFIPIVEPHPERPGEPAPFTVDPEPYGAFLCTLFDRWMGDFKEGRPTTSIRFFESLFHLYAGVAPPECTLLERCGIYVVVEHNGDVYACDFFVTPEWRLGNLLEGDRLEALLNSPKQESFAEAKAALPGECRSCRWIALCRGGCPKDRIASPQGKSVNHLCPAFKQLFTHADERMQRLAEAWHRERTETEERLRRTRALIQAAGHEPGRNDPCPCGSGLKYKKCCGREL